MRAPLLFALVASTAAAPSGAAELYAAGSTLYCIDLPDGTIRAEQTLDTQATDLLVDPGGRYVAATTSSGLHLFRPGTLDPIRDAVLGVLDAVEASPSGDTLLVLLHPGPDRRRPTGQHLVLSMRHDDLASSRAIARLGPESYDMVLAPDGRRLVVTRLVGRTVDVIDLAPGAERALRITDGTERNTLCVLRALAFVSPTRALVGESAKGRPLVLWDVDIESGDATAHETTWTMHASDVLVAGDEVIVNGRDQVARFDGATRAPLDRHDLVLDAWHAVAAPNGDVYFAAPDETGARILRLLSGGGEITEVLALPARVVRLALPPGSKR